MATSKKARARILRTITSYLSLPPHPSRKYMHWTGSVEQALDLEDLYDKVVTEKNKADFAKLASIIQSNAEKDGADNNNPDI